MYNPVRIVTRLSNGKKGKIVCKVPPASESISYKGKTRGPLEREFGAFMTMRQKMYNLVGFLTTIFCQIVCKAAPDSESIEYKGKVREAL